MEKRYETLFLIKDHEFLKIKEHCSTGKLTEGSWLIRWVADLL